MLVALSYERQLPAGPPVTDADRLPPQTAACTHPPDLYSVCVYVCYSRNNLSGVLMPLRKPACLRLDSFNLSVP